MVIIEGYLEKGYYALGYIGYNYLEFSDINVKLGIKELESHFPQLYINFYKADKLISYKKEEVDKINKVILKNELSVIS